MTATLAQIWRHPIKGIGTEELARVAVSADQPLPMDRAWAVLEDGGDAAPGWRACRNFLRGAKGPSLMAISAETAAQHVTLTHPDKAPIRVHLEEGPAPDLFSWLSDIYPEDRRAPTTMVKAPSIGMADAPFASISVLNLASLRALSQKAGHNLDTRRFRGNLWLDGLAPWEEFDLVGKTLVIGAAELEVVEPIGRCRATEANPETGQRDTPTLQLLQDGWGHTEFGVYAKVTVGGDIAVGDSVSVK